MKRIKLDLTVDEFTLLSAAAMDGLKKDGTSRVETARALVDATAIQTLADKMITATKNSIIIVGEEEANVWDC